MLRIITLLLETMTISNRIISLEIIILLHKIKAMDKVITKEKSKSNNLLNTNMDKMINNNTLFLYFK
jgi:hypothetical protein